MPSRQNQADDGVLLVSTVAPEGRLRDPLCTINGSEEIRSRLGNGFRNAGWVHTAPLRSPTARPLFGNATSFV